MTIKATRGNDIKCEQRYVLRLGDDRGLFMSLGLLAMYGMASCLTMSLIV
ncbi:MAG: hypothetical protein WBB01_11335 [Phormidesmis sp.]